MDFVPEASRLWGIVSCAFWEVHLFIYSNTECLPVLPLIIWVTAVPDEHPGLRQRASITSIIVFCIEKGIFGIGKVKDIINMDAAYVVGFGKNVLCET